MKRMALLVAAALGVAGCTSSMSPEMYQLIRTALRKDPAFMQLSYDACVRDMNEMSASDSALYAARVRIPVKNVASVYCTRVLNGWKSGRLTLEEYRKLGNINPNTNEIRIVQGK
ncbi:hypothetical protein MAUB1S_08360 [Mycolicibacterium aubagnense]